MIPIKHGLCNNIISRTNLLPLFGKGRIEISGSRTKVSPDDGLNFAYTNLGARPMSRFFTHVCISCLLNSPTNGQLDTRHWGSYGGWGNKQWVFRETNDQMRICAFLSWKRKKKLNALLCGTEGVNIEKAYS